MYFLRKQSAFLCSVFSLSANLALAQLLQLDFIDKDTGNPVACRVEPTKAPKRFPKPRTALTSSETILFEASANLKPPVGEYEFTASRGIEFADIQGGFGVEKDNEGQFDVVFHHKTKMNALNWYSGDLASNLPLETLQRWSAAEALNMTICLTPSSAEQSAAPAQPKANSPDKQIIPDSPLQVVQRSYRIPSGPQGVSVILHPIKADQELPAEIASSKTLYDCLDAIRSLNRDEWIIELSDIWNRDLPILLAVLNVDAVQVLSSHLKRKDSLKVTSAFYNPDPKRFFDAKGLGRLMEYSYWQMLDAGFKLTPSAASHFAADGKSIVGYNRVYTWIDPNESKTPEVWWRNFKSGFTMFTNGPLLRLTVNGQSPGGILKGSAGESIYTHLEADLTVQDEVDYLDIIFNGDTKYQAKLEEHARRGKFPELGYKESGWMLVRVVTAYPDGYRLASTAPTYFEFGGQTRISRKAVQFFQNWLEAASKQITSDPTLAATYKTSLAEAKRFWMERSLSANVP